MGARVGRRTRSYGQRQKCRETFSSPRQSRISLSPSHPAEDPGFVLVLRAWSPGMAKDSGLVQLSRLWKKAGSSQRYQQNLRSLFLLPTRPPSSHQELISACVAYFRALGDVFSWSLQACFQLETPSSRGPPPWSTSQVPPR